MKTLVAFLVLATAWAVFPATAFADMTCTAGSCIGIPNRILLFSGGTIRIFPYHGSQQLTETTCQPTGESGNAIDLRPDGLGTDRIYSTLLAAILAGKTVFLRTPDAATPCEVNYIYMIND